MISRWIPYRRIACAASVIGIVAAVLGACGTDPTAVETCRRIEEARCRMAPACNDINLDVPPHNGDSPGDKIEGCILWYHDACLHGFMAAEGDGAQVRSCIDAINTGDCNVVAHPETHASCAWIVPPELRPPPPDAGGDR